MALENVRRSIYRTDTAPVFDKPDYAGMYERQAIQMRQEKKYGEQITRQRTKDFSDLTKMDLDPTITDAALKGYEMANYNKYMDKVKKLAATRDGALTNEDIVNIRGAQGMVLQAQAQARDAQARWSAAGKTMADPRNEGLYDEDYYNTATENMREWFRTGGESGEMPKSFLDMSAEQAVPHFTNVGDDLEKKSYEYKTREGDKDVTRGYEQSTITKEQAQDIVRREMEGSRRVRKGVIEDWQRIDPNREQYKTYEEFAMNNDEYLDAILGPRAELYKEKDVTETESTDKYGRSKDEDWITFNPAQDGYLMQQLNNGAGFKVASVPIRVPKMVDGKEARDKDDNIIREQHKVFKNGIITMANPKEGWADITLPEAEEVSAAVAGAFGADFKAFNISINPQSGKKVDKFMWKTIRVPYDYVGTMLYDAGIRFEGVDDETDPSSGGKYNPKDFTGNGTE